MSIWQYDVALNWTGASGSPGVNIWHLRDVDPDTGNGNLQDRADQLETFYTAIRSLYPQPVTISFDGTVRSIVTGDADPEIRGIGHSWSVTGTSDAGFVPPANCIVLGLRTSAATRSGRGRKFIGPVQRSQNQDNGTVLEAGRQQLLTAAQGLLEGTDNPVNGAWGVYSQTEQVIRDIVSFTVSNKFGVLRSRRD